MKTVTHPANFQEWRTRARHFLLSKIPPQEILWQEKEQASLFQTEENSSPSVKGQLPQVPKAFLDLAQTAACHRSNEQWSLLYAMLWRITHGEKHLLSLATDPEVHRLLHRLVRARPSHHSPQRLFLSQALSWHGLVHPHS